MLVAKKADHSCCWPLCPKLAKDRLVTTPSLGGMVTSLGKGGYTLHFWVHHQLVSCHACLSHHLIYAEEADHSANHCVINWRKPLIALQEASYHPGPPDFLTVSIHEFLKVCLDILDDTAKLASAAFCDLACAFEGTDEDMNALHHKYIKLFIFLMVSAVSLCMIDSKIAICSTALWTTHLISVIFSTSQILIYD